MNQATSTIGSYLAWVAKQYFLFMFQPSVYVLETRKIKLAQDRQKYILKFLTLPVLIFSLFAFLTAYIGGLCHIAYSPTTTVINITFGVAVGLMIGIPVGRALGVCEGLAFGMAVGVMTGFSFSIWTTIPLPASHFPPNRFVPFDGIFPYHRASSLVFAPLRDVAITTLMAAFGGFYIQTITAILGNATRGVIFGIGLGIMHGIAVILFVDPTIGLISGTMVGILCAIGFAHHRKNWGSIFFSLAYGVAFGLPIWQGYHYAPQPAYDPNKWGLVIGLTTTFVFWLTYHRYIMYPIYILTTATLYFSIGKWGEAATLWQKCPVVWDETIQAPLPFITEFLIRLGRENRGDMNDAISFLVAERMSHYKVAMDAFVQLIPEDLEVESTDDITQIPNKIAWMQGIPEELVRGLSRTLEDFDRVAGLTSRYSTTDYQLVDRRVSLLEKAIKETEYLQKSLHIADAASVVKFLSTANQWLAILRTERQQYPPLTTKQIPQTFILGKSLQENSDMFVGRSEIFAKIENSCVTVESPTILFYGPRRMGKSSILRRLHRNISKQIIHVPIDCLDARVTASLESHINVLTEKISEAIRGSGISCEPPNVGHRDGDTYSLFRQWLHGVMENMGERKILLSIDEYEKLDDILKASWGKQLLDNYRHIANNYPRFFIMFTGVKSFDRLGLEWTDSGIHTYPIRLSFLKKEEATELLMAPCISSDMTYQEDCITHILTETHCQPFLLQAVGFELIELLNSDERTIVTSEDINIAVSTALETARAYFANRWLEAEKEEQAILTAVALDQPVPNYPEAKIKLIEDDVLTRSDQFVVPMFERWVRENCQSL